WHNRIDGNNPARDGSISLAVQRLALPDARSAHPTSPDFLGAEPKGQTGHRHKTKTVRPRSTFLGVRWQQTSTTVHRSRLTLCRQRSHFPSQFGNNSPYTGKIQTYKRQFCLLPEFLESNTTPLATKRQTDRRGDTPASEWSSVLL